MKNIDNRLIMLLLWIAVVIQLCFIVADLDWSTPEYDELKTEYQHSQYNLDQGYEFYGNMQDHRLYAYTGMEYVRGVSPALLNFEHPPLAKYVFGVAHLLTGNMMWVQFLSYVLFLSGSWVLARQIGLGKLGSLLVIQLLISDGLMQDHLQLLNLDYIHNALVVWALVVLVRVINDRKQGVSLWSLNKTQVRVSALKSSFLWKILSVEDSLQNDAVLTLILGILIGGAMATRALVSGGLLLAFSLMVLMVKFGKRSLPFLVRVMLGTGIIYTTSYAVVIWQEGLWGWMMLHEKITRFFLSYLPDYPWWEIWRVFLIGQWKTWFASPLLQPVTGYQAWWPVMFGLMMWQGWMTWKRHKEERWSVLILLGWFWTYMLFNSTHVVFPKLLIVVLPVVYGLGVKGVMEIAQDVKKRFQERE